MRRLKILDTESSILVRRIKKSGFIYYMRRDIFLYLLMFLPMVYIFLFKYGPMYGVLMAFQNYNLFNGIWGSQWVGLDIFKEIFQRNEFWRAVRNTFLLNGLDLAAGFPAPIILALLLNELRNLRFKKITQTVLYLPHFLSWVIIGGITFLMFSSNGLANHSLISLLGINDPIPFLSNKLNWLIVYVIIGIWQNAGWGTIIYLAAIAGINRELYEAVEVDGAGRFKKMWHITLHSIKPTIIILLILQLGRMVSIGFDRPFNIGNSLVSEYSDVISTYVYAVGLKAGEFSQATAIGLFQSVVSMAFLLAANTISEKSGEQGIW